MASDFVYGDEWEGREELLDEAETIVSRALSWTGKSWSARGTLTALPLVRPALVSWDGYVDLEAFDDRISTADPEIVVEMVSRMIEWRSRRWSVAERRVMPMPKTWWEPAARAYPQLYTPPQYSLGWADILLAATTWINESETEWAFSDAKEKLGTLRLSTRRLTLDHSYAIVDAAEYVAVHVCQVCGAPGTQSGDFMTLCHPHRAEKSWRLA